MQLQRPVAVSYFNPEHFMKLLVLTKCAVQGALEWLETNQDKSLEEIQAQSEQAGDEDGPALQPGEEPRSLVCNECGKQFRSTAQAEFHASKSQHVDFSESTEEIAPLTEDQKKERLNELREKLAAKRAVQSEQDKADQKRNEVCAPLLTGTGNKLTREPGNPAEEHQREPRCKGRAPEESSDEGGGQEEEGEAG